MSAGRPFGGARQSGASLIEVMIGMVLGLLLMAGLLQVYQSSSTSRKLNDALISRQENLRFATILITQELRMAGFRGCLRFQGSNAQLFNNVLHNNVGSFLFDFTRHVQGFDAVGASWAPALDASLPTNIVTGTDVFSVRSVVPGVSAATQVGMNASNDVVTIAPNQIPRPFEPTGGDIVLLSDCTGGTFFQITSYDPVTGIIQHAQTPAGGVPSPGNSTATFGFRYPAGSELTQVTTTSYFVAPSASGVGNSLWRQRGPALPTELVEGIEQMQVQYGLDNDGDMVPDVYVNATAGTNWRAAVAVRVALLAVSRSGKATAPDTSTYTLLDQTFGPYNDTKLRRVMNFTAAVRNQLP